jgi:hypothetical protein
MSIELALYGGRPLEARNEFTSEINSEGEYAGAGGAGNA